MDRKIKKARQQNFKRCIFYVNIDISCGWFIGIVSSFMIYPLFENIKKGNQYFLVDAMQTLLQLYFKPIRRLLQSFWKTR